MWRGVARELMVVENSYYSWEMHDKLERAGFYIQDRQDMGRK